jgi:pimeloyl-ACP methyl ester carboxylesterase
MKFFKAQIEDHSLDISFIHRQRSEDLILFLHGIACTKNGFRYLYDDPLFEDYSLLFYDMAGHGDSSKPDDFSYNMEAQALICLQLLDQFPHKKLHLVAHSMGSAVALLLPVEILSQIGSFANLEGNLIGEDCYFTRRIIQNSFEDYREIVFEKQKRKFVDNILFEYDKTTPAAIYKTAESLVYWSDSNSLLTRFHELRCRRAYFIGDQTPDLAVSEQLGNIPIITVPDAGHAMMIENPGEFNKILYNFIEAF